MIVRNKKVRSISLTDGKLEEGSRARSINPPSPVQMATWNQMARCATPRFALGVFVVCLVLLAGTTELSRGLVIGDSGTGAPELRANSRYNHDDRQIATTYNIGTDVLSIIVEEIGRAHV